jgi:hypothetical protein
MEVSRKKIKQPYFQWTIRDKQRFGFGNPQTQREFTKRISNGMSVAEAAADMDEPERAAAGRL